jgi:hypothetical protein
MPAKLFQFSRQALASNDMSICSSPMSISADASEGKPSLYADDLYQEKALDLSHTYQGLNANSALATGDANKLYFLPFGGKSAAYSSIRPSFRTKGFRDPYQLQRTAQLAAPLWPATMPRPTQPNICPCKATPVLSPLI